MYQLAPINQLYRPSIRVTEGSAEITMGVDPAFFHGARALHGSVYFKMLDDASFFAVNSLVEDVFILTTSFTSYMTRPVSSGALTARGKVVHAGKSVFLAEAILSNADGKEIARGNGAFMRSPIPLTPDIGYRD
jgi:uncharacterized protein (TIGR00369 family)